MLLNIIDPEFEMVIRAKLMKMQELHCIGDGKDILQIIFSSECDQFVTDGHFQKFLSLKACKK